MDDSIAVRVIERVGDLHRQHQALGKRERLGRAAGTQRLVEGHPFDIFHHQIGRPIGIFSDVIDGNDAGVGELAGGSRLAVETLLLRAQLFAPHAVCENHFQSHSAADLRVHRLINGPHRASSQLLYDLVAPDGPDGLGCIEIGSHGPLDGNARLRSSQRRRPWRRDGPRPTPSAGDPVAGGS